jgi:RHS repeat-associated protein
MGGVESTSAADSTGAFTLSIPLPVSPCRGFEPHLSLSYHSSGGHGPFGLGFTLSLPSILRRLTKGYPNYDSSDEFVHGGEPLVPGAKFQHKFEGADYDVTPMRPRLDPGTDRLELFESQDGAFWRLLTGDGETFFFGRTMAARVEKEGRVFEWLLEEARNAKGETISYLYKADGAERYLERVRYGEGHFEVAFDYVERADVWRSYEAGFERRTAYLCRAARVLHSFPELGPEPVLVRMLQFSYDSAKLVRVDLIGFRDGEQQSVPPLKLEYTPFVSHPKPAQLETAAPAEAMFVDLDGEGAPGLLAAPLYWAASRGVRKLPWTEGRLLDVLGEGKLRLVREAQPAGFFDGDIFKAFDRFPSDAQAAGREFLDLSGSGLSDIAVLDARGVAYYPSLGAAGYGPLRRGSSEDGFPLDDGGPEAFTDFAPIFGTGGHHRVRITRDKILAWPHLGHGRFADAVALPGPDLGAGFDAARLHLASLDGSGALDLLYVRGDVVEVYRHCGGNGFMTSSLVVPLPAPARFSWQVTIADVHGCGCECLVFTQAPGAPKRWVWDFCGGTKAALLCGVEGGMGASAKVSYAASKGLASPVQVVAALERSDAASGITTKTTYAYFHPRYDAAERQFCGFGRVDRADFDSMTRTWYHTGAGDERQRFASEFFAGDPDAFPAVLDKLEGPPFLLHGAELREEVYGLDSPLPYGVSEHAHWLRREGEGVFSVHSLDTVDYDYERVPTDPRITRETTLELDAFGNVTRARQTAYARRRGPETLPEQSETKTLTHTAAFSPPVLGDDERLMGRVVEEKSFDGETLLSWDRYEYAELGLLRRHLIAELEQKQVAELFGGLVPDSLLSGPGGYVLDQGYWWKSGPAADYDPERFYLPRNTATPFGAVTSFVYDAHSLLLVSATTKAPGVLELMQTADRLDYVALVPLRLTDANGAVSEVAIDALARVVATSHGKPGHPDGFAPLSGWKCPAVTFEQALADPEMCLQGAATFHLYEPEARPARALTLTNESYAPGGPFGVSVLYEDGAGNELQALRLIEPSKWARTGAFAFDGKGRKTHRYDPAFAQGPAFDPKPAGLSAVLHYDAMDHVVRVDHPSGAFEKNTLTPWRHESFDANDTLLDSDLYKRKPADPYEAEALENSVPHAGTPEVAHLDPLGRAVRHVHEAVKGTPLVTTIGLDARGRRLWSADPRLGASNLRSDERVHSFGGQLLRERSADAGEILTLADAYDRPLLARDARGFTVLHSYDGHGRPSDLRVRDGDGPEPLDNLVDRFVYGDSVDAGLDDPKDRNLLGRVYRHYDQAGLSETPRCDPYGHPLEERSRLRLPVGEADWSGDPQAKLEAEEFCSTFSYDALGRVVSSVGPAGHVQWRSYFLWGGLKAYGLDSRTYGEVVSYDAKGRSVEECVGNGVHRLYEYDPATQLLKRASWVKDGKTLFSQAYYHDPVGNVTRVNEVDYRYDALYRLVSSGAESYKYDDGSNLRKLGARQISVEETSNRLSGPHDAGGNILELDALKFTWNYRDNVAGSEGPEGSQRNVYDADGQRARKIVTRGDTRVDSIYAGDLELRRVYEKGILVSELRRVLVNGGVAERLEWSDARPAQDRYPVSDQLDSRRLELGGEGQVLDAEEYEPYGQTRSASGEGLSDKRRGYSGEEKDENGLYYYGHRYYVPWLGRWLSPDPAGDVDGLNLYQFAGGNPVTYADLGGLAIHLKGKKAAAGKKAGNKPLTSGLKTKVQASILGPRPAKVRAIAKLALMVKVSTKTSAKMIGRAVPDVAGSPTAPVNQANVKAFLAQGKPAAENSGVRIRWKGNRAKSGAKKTSGIAIFLTTRTSQAWRTKHKAASDRASLRFKTQGMSGLQNGSAQWWAEISHLLAGSLYGPNDPVSAIPASVHQNTEWLAIEEGVKDLAKNWDVRIKLTGVMDNDPGRKGQLLYSRYKIYIGKKKVFDHITLGGRGNIDKSEGSALKTQVKLLSPASPDAPSPWRGSTAAKGIVGKAPGQLMMKNGHFNSLNSPAFTDVQDRTGTLFAGSAKIGGQDAMDVVMNDL